MKQALAIMAVVMVALLVVSGFIVSGSIRQQEQLTAKVEQVNELKVQIKTLQQDYNQQAAELESALSLMDEQSTALEAAQEQSLELDELTAAYNDQLLALKDLNELSENQAKQLTALGKENGEMKTAWGDAQASADESNAALAQLEMDWAAHEAQCTQELDDLTKLSAQRETMINDLGAQLTEAQKERDDALAELETLKGGSAEIEAAAAKASLLEEERNGYQDQVSALKAELAENKGYQEQFGSLKAEVEEYTKALAVLSAYQKGDMAGAEARRAIQAFEAAYPESMLTFIWVKAE